MSNLTNITKEINKLKERNKKVETNKAWELSITRKIILFILTYIVAGITLSTIQNPDPWKNALIPSIGFYLSTFTMPQAKKIWQKYIYEK